MKKESRPWICQFMIMMGLVLLLTNGCEKEEKNDLEGKWQREDGMGILITGSRGEFYSFGTGMWKNANEQSFVKLGDLKLTEITEEGSLEWSCYELWYAATGQTINKVQWSLVKGSISMTEDRKSITTTSTSPVGTTASITYTRQE